MKILSKFKAMSTWKKVLVSLVIVALVLVLVVAAVAGYLAHSVTKDIDTVPIKHSKGVKQNSDAINFLVLGSDVRLDASNAQSWKEGGNRTDAMMLMQVSPKNNTATIMSIPRDSWVNIPGHKKAKINAAFSWGGPSLAVETVESLTKVHIDHFALVNFETFKSLTDELGGVEIATQAGTKNMNGEQALAFVRERHALPNGDFDRVKRQQAWMRAIMSKVFAGDVLNSPSKTYSFVQTALKDATVDEDLTTSTMMSIAAKAKNIRGRDIIFLTAPTTGVGRSADGQSIVNLDFKKLEELMNAWVGDDLNKYIKEQGSELSYLSNKVN